MRRSFLLAAGFLLSTAATLDAKVDAGASLLSPAELDPRAVLPLPPAAGSPQATAELAELHAMQVHRTAAEAAAASAEGEVKGAEIFGEVLGPKFDLARLPATMHLIDLVRATEKDVVDRGKAEFQRKRPWIVDPTIQNCSRSEDPLSSYPSGHTSRAFAMAGVLARLLPAHASAIMGRAAHYGESRIICEQHFRSDVTAGEALGLLIAERLLAKPDLAPAIHAARVELGAAGIE